jgi:hypothetical protein
MKFSSVSCPQGCSEIVLSLDTGERKRGEKEAWGERAGRRESEEGKEAG